MSAARFKRDVEGGSTNRLSATDPNPKHAGRGFRLLIKAGVKVTHGLLADQAARLNETFNHWIVHHTPFIMVKAAMTLDGRSGQSLV